MNKTEFDGLKSQWETLKGELNQQQQVLNPNIVTCVTKISTIIQNAENKRAVKKPVSEEKENKIKKLIMESYESTNNYNIIEEDFRHNNKAECIRSLEILERNVKTAGRAKLLFYSREGELIYHIRRFDRNYIGYLEERGLKLSKSYCSALISFYKLTLEFPGLARCACPFREIISNLGLVEKVCNDLKMVGFW